MLIALRLLFALALLYGFRQAWANAQTAPETGDLTNAFWLAYCVVVAIANALVWAPFFGARLSEPLTGVITDSTYRERAQVLLRLARWLDRHGWRRLTLGICFLEGIHHPAWPVAFVLGLKNAAPGSWLEKVYAREVFRFDNAHNCLQAYAALQRHGVEPPPHPNAQINLLLRSLAREAKPDPGRLELTAAPQPALKRHPQIRLFESAQPASAPPDPTSPSPPQSEAANSSAQPSAAGADAGSAAGTDRGPLTQVWARLGSWVRRRGASRPSPPPLEGPPPGDA
jgi:hypothetical protein